MEHRGFDVMVLTETKVQSEDYLHNCLGCDVACSMAHPSSARGSQGGVGMVTRERPVGWDINSTRYHGPNVVSYKIVTGLTLNPLVGLYLPPLCPWGFERGPRRSKELAEPARVGPPCKVRSHRPGPTLPTAQQVSIHEDLVTSQAGNRPPTEMRLNSWVRPAPL